MARRSRKSRTIRRNPRLGRWLLMINLAVALAIGGWYTAQPVTRQGEVRQLVGNYFEKNKRVSALDIAWDIWQLYYADSASGRIAVGDQGIVYGGVPKAGSWLGTTSFRVLKNRAYVVGYSDALRGPLWAAYHVRDLESLPSPSPRPETFEVDPRTVARVASADYTNSGYDRGHMAPNYAIATRYGEEAQRETFLMSNITPQLHTLNAGLWKQMEMKIATSYPARYSEVWVIVGPVFGPRPHNLRSGVAVPEAFFLIVIDETEGKLRTQALIFPQDTPSGGDPDRFLTSIAEIQRRTGLDFLTELDDETETLIESRRASRVW